MGTHLAYKDCILTIYYIIITTVKGEEGEEGTDDMACIVMVLVVISAVDTAGR